VGKWLRIATGVDDGLEVLPGQEGVPDIGLGVGGRTAPTLAGAQAAAGAQALWIFLPGEYRPGTLDHRDLDPIGITAARGQPFRLVPHHMEGFYHPFSARVITLDQHA